MPLNIVGGVRIPNLRIVPRHVDMVWYTIETQSNNLEI